MGQMLNAFFASVFTTERVDELPDCSDVNKDFSLKDQDQDKDLQCKDQDLSLIHI